MAASDSMLMQLPTPLDCISSTLALAAEPGARGDGDAFLLGRQDRRDDFGVGLEQFDQLGVASIGHISNLADAGRLQAIVDLDRPVALEHCRWIAGPLQPKRRDIAVFRRAAFLQPFTGSRGGLQFMK